MRVDAPVQYSTVPVRYNCRVFSLFSLPFPLRVTLRAYRRTVRIACPIRTVRCYARAVGVPHIWVLIQCACVRTNRKPVFGVTRYARLRGTPL